MQPNTKTDLAVFFIQITSAATCQGRTGKGKASSLDIAPLTILNSGTFYNLGSGSSLALTAVPRRRQW